MKMIWNQNNHEFYEKYFLKNAHFHNKCTKCVVELCIVPWLKLYNLLIVKSSVIYKK